MAQSGGSRCTATPGDLIAHPVARRLEVLRPEAGRWTMPAAFPGVASAVRAEPFDRLDLELTLLWDDPPPAR